MKTLVASLLLLSSFAVSALAADKIRIVTEATPPLQIQKAHQPATGAMVDVVRLLLDEAGIHADIEVYPWARAYQIAKSQKNTLIFSMLRSKEREPLFHWIGELYQIDSYLVSLKQRSDISLHNLADAKRYKVGAVRQDIADSYLRQHGFIEEKNLFLARNYKKLWPMLYSGRTDIAFTNGIIYRHEITDIGLDANQISKQYKIPDAASKLYLAANLHSDPALLEKLRRALQAIKADGRYQKILQQWQL